MSKLFFPWQWGGLAATTKEAAATAEADATVETLTLATLPRDAATTVVGLDAACHGFARRRLLDLGFTPGTSVTPALETFVRDPRAYRLRGTLVALRRDQAEHVLVRPVGRLAHDQSNGKARR